MRTHPALRAALAAAALAATAPGAGVPGAEEPAAPADARAQATRAGPPTARWGVVDELRAEQQAPRHASDGGGRAWLEPPPASEMPAQAASPGQWTIVYEAGPLGIAPGGTLRLQVPRVWGWSPPQAEQRRRLGFVEITSDAPGVRLVAHALPRNLLDVRVEERALGAGQRVRLVYGAGLPAAMADQYAERGSRFWLRVDGDGDGAFATLADAPAVDVLPGPPARLALHLPGSARPGEPVELRVAVLDALGNAGVAFEGDVKLSAPGGGLALPESVQLAAPDRGARRVTVRVLAAGVHRVVASAGGRLEAESHPMLAERSDRVLLWGDLHGHSHASDGTGTPEDYFRYARDAAGLDVVALTDHDHYGPVLLDESPERWAEIQRVAKEFHEPGHFVTLPGYEWTSWIWGHRHVLFFSDRAELVSSFREASDEPAELWAALRDRHALTVPHHPAGGPVAIDWSIPPDPELEPVVEVVSVHGSSEAPDAPRPIYGAVEGHFARDALARGYRLGFVGSGDSHDGHPGHAQLAAGGSGGLAGLWARGRTRADVLAALRAREVYATSGPRIALRAELAGRPMGALVPAPAAGATARLAVQIAAPQPITHVDVLRSGAPPLLLPGENQRELSLEAQLAGLVAGDWVYVRVWQNDGHAAWSSPHFVVAAEVR